MNGDYIKKFSNLDDRAMQMAKLIRERQIQRATEKLQDKANDRKDNNKEKDSESNR